MLKSLGVIAASLAVGGQLSACAWVRDGIYGERGVRDVVQSGQVGSAGQVDLAFLLDPEGMRFSPGPGGSAATPSMMTAFEHDSEIDRALFFFEKPRNNRVGDMSTACIALPGPERFATVTIDLQQQQVGQQRVNGQNQPVGDPMNLRTVSRTEKVALTPPGPQQPPKCTQALIQQKRRNEITERLIAASEFQCERYKDFLTQIDADVAFGAGVAISGLTAAAALVDGASQILAAAAGGVAASAVAISESYFNNRAIGAVLQAIDTDRIEIRNEIRMSLRRPVNRYTMAQALGDINRFHYACSLRAGVDTLEATTLMRLQRVRQAATAMGTDMPMATVNPEPSQNGQRSDATSPST